jgi:hypothetical protein
MACMVKIKIFKEKIVIYLLLVFILQLCCAELGL